MRLFIAVCFSSEFILSLNREIKDLAIRFPNVKWVKSENLHLTLKFLGNTDNEKINVVKNILEKIVEEFKPFKLEFHGLSCFERRELIILLRIKNNEILESLTENIDTEMGLLGFKKENSPFSPHITVGRGKRLNKAQQEEIINNIRKYKAAMRNITVNEIILMESKLSPQGPKYFPRARFALS